MYMYLHSFPFDVVSKVYTGMLKPLIFDQNEQEYRSTKSLGKHSVLIAAKLLEQHRSFAPFVSVLIVSILVVSRASPHFLKIHVACLYTHLCGSSTMYVLVNVHELTCGSGVCGWM